MAWRRHPYAVKFTALETSEADFAVTILGTWGASHTHVAIREIEWKFGSA